jgi:hypothetical protein
MRRERRWIRPDCRVSGFARSEVTADQSGIRIGLWRAKEGGVHDNEEGGEEEEA